MESRCKRRNSITTTGSPSVRTRFTSRSSVRNLRLRVAWATDPGLEREENEDSVVVWRNKAGLDSLLIVCDGMGGHAAGQTASSIACKTFAAVLAEDGDEGPDLNRLKRACKQANSAVFDAARKNPEWAGMGSTLVVAAIRGGDLGLVNVGDSPA